MRGYVTASDRWVELDDNARPRKRTKICDIDRAELEQRQGRLYCPVCGRTVDEMAVPS